MKKHESIIDVILLIDAIQRKNDFYIHEKIMRCYTPYVIFMNQYDETSGDYCLIKVYGPQFDNNSSPEVLCYQDMLYTFKTAANYLETEKFWIQIYYKPKIEISVSTALEIAKAIKNKKIYTDSSVIKSLLNKKVSKK